MRRDLLLSTCLLAVACSPGSSGGDAGTAADAGSPDAGSPDAAEPDAAEGDAGVRRPEALARLEGYLLGDFDNQAQFDRGFPQLVERHVCRVPGAPEDPEVLWLYVEHVEHVAQGRDAYFIRVNEVRLEGEAPVSKAYRFPMGHTLRTNAFAFNGPRDACFHPELLGAFDATLLEYRQGCDVTFTADGLERFDAVSAEETCTFPGGWIQTVAEVWADGLDSRDRAVSPQGESGSTFEFRRVSDFTPPGG